MIRHFYKRKISSYEVKGTNKRLVKVFQIPKNIYNKLASYKYDNIIFKSIFYCYEKVNSIYNIFIDEVLTMFSDLFYDVVNDHMEKNANNVNNPKFVGFFNKNQDVLNNMFISMIDKIPDPYQIPNINNKNIKFKSSNILDEIKKFNNLDKPKLETKSNHIEAISDKTENKQVENKQVENTIDNISDEDIRHDYMVSKNKLSDKETDRILDEELENFFKQQELNTLQENLKNLSQKFNNIEEQIL